MFTMALIHVILLFFWVTIGFAAMELPTKLSHFPVGSGLKIIQMMDMDVNSIAALEIEADRNALI